VRGLGECNGALPLTLAQEWLRGDRWGSSGEFSANAEYAYVLGLAGMVPVEYADCVSLTTFAGQRDHGNEGLSVADFMTRANDHLELSVKAAGIEVTAASVLLACANLRQLFHALAALSSCAVQLRCPAALSSCAVQLRCPA
jgi:hypothetical protein